MIANFKHKGLRQLYEEDNAKGVNAQHREKLEDILAVMDAATKIEDLNLPTFGLHPLKGNRKGWWAITVRANWRVIFRFVNGIVCDVDLVDYH
jgi:proteic killer suppression protein